MSALSFEVKITAVGEVRDKYGNLLSASPVEFNPVIMTQAQIDALPAELRTPQPE